MWETIVPPLAFKLCLTFEHKRPHRRAELALARLSKNTIQTLFLQNAPVMYTHHTPMHIYLRKAQPQLNYQCKTLTTHIKTAITIAKSSEGFSSYHCTGQICNALFRVANALSHEDEQRTKPIPKKCVTNPQAADLGTQVRSLKPVTVSHAVCSYKM